MALALRLRRSIVVTSTSVSLFRPPASAPISRAPLSLAPFVPLPRPWLLPGAAAGFRSTAAAAAATGYSPYDEVVPGGDYNHWIVSMHFPDPKPSREEMIEIYLQTLAKVVGSYEEAKRRMYAFSTTDYTGFQARMTEDVAEKFCELPEVFSVLPDSYIFPEKKQYAGDQYDNGTITPFRPRNYWGKSSRPDKKHTLLKEQSESPFHCREGRVPFSGAVCCVASAPQPARAVNAPHHAATAERNGAEVNRTPYMAKKS